MTIEEIEQFNKLIVTFENNLKEMEGLVTDIHKEPVKLSKCCDWNIDEQGRCTACKELTIPVSI